MTPQFLVPSDRPSPGSCLGLLRPLVWSMRPLVATERMSFLPSGQSLLSTSLEQEWASQDPRGGLTMTNPEGFALNLFYVWGN